MDQAITIGNVVEFLFAVGGIAALIALLVFILWIMNPFRTGH